jgi:hypothetical protein
MKKFSVLVVSALLVLIFLNGCTATDVVGKFAVTSFNTIINLAGEKAFYVPEDGAWAIESSAGDRVLFAEDFSRNTAASGMADMDKPDAKFVFEAEPFIAAGLDISKLPATEGIKYKIKDGKFMLHFELSGDKFPQETEKTFEAVFARIVGFQRDRIGYHEKLDHYGIKLGNGNMFEWAKDPAVNDKDLVWILNPEPLIAAGLDPAKLKGWIFTKVDMMDEAGKTIFVDKFLKPFDLK